MKIKLLIFAAALVFAGVSASAQCKGKCRNGKGVYTFDDGEVYDGTFVEGKFHGKGTYIYKSGAKYVGEFKDGKRDGKGTYSYPTGDIYTGDFVAGKPEGKGVYTFATGDRYEGEFKGGKRHGTVHSARVEISNTEGLRHDLRGGTLAGTGPAVNGYYVIFAALTHEWA